MNKPGLKSYIVFLVEGVTDDMHAIVGIAGPTASILPRPFPSSFMLPSSSGLPSSRFNSTILDTTHSRMKSLRALDCLSITIGNVPK